MYRLLVPGIHHGSGTSPSHPRIKAFLCGNPLQIFSMEWDSQFCGLDPTQVIANQRPCTYVCFNWSLISYHLLSIIDMKCSSIQSLTFQYATGVRWYVGRMYPPPHVSFTPHYQKVTGCEHVMESVRKLLPIQIGVCMCSFECYVMLHE